jgi:hypothetical protein
MVRLLNVVFDGVEELMQRLYGADLEKWCACDDDVVLCRFCRKA